MARDRAATAKKAPRKPESRPASRARRALLALSPAALGAAGFFISGLKRGDGDARAADREAPSADPADEMTDHRKAYYDRARF